MSTLLAIHLEMTGRVDRAGDPAALQQPRPVMLQARLIPAGAGDPVAAMDVVIRPEGWEVPSAMRRRFADTAGVPIRSALGLLRAMTNAAHVIVAHDYDETSEALQVCRIINNGTGYWCSHQHARVCTARKAAKAMGTNSLPDLYTATKTLLHRSVPGIDGVLALYEQLPAMAAGSKAGEVA